MKNEEIIEELEKRRKQIIQEFEINISAISNTIQLLKNENEQSRILHERITNQLVTYEDNIEVHSLRGKIMTETILNILKYKNRFLHNSEITELMQLIYLGRDKDKFPRQISGILSKLKKGKKVASFSDSSSQKDIYWGFNEWLVENKIIEGHEYYKNIGLRQQSSAR